MTQTDSDTGQAAIQSIPGSCEWVSYDSISHGDSSDQKFRIRDADGESYMLRIAAKTEYEQRKTEYSVMDYLYRQHAAVPRPVQYGVSKNGQSTYILRNWIAGDTCHDHLQRTDPVRQYALGHELAVSIAALHACDGQRSADEWSDQMNQRIRLAVNQLSSRDIQLVCIQKLIGYLRSNRKLVDDRPQTLIHGDINLSNIILSQGGSPYLIDFEKSQVGDPLYDFASVIVDISPVSCWFATGLLDCYFSYQVRTKIHQLIVYYAALRSLCRFSAACNQSRNKRQTALRQVQQVVKYYRDMTLVIPEWYEELPEMQI